MRGTSFLRVIGRMKPGMTIRTGAAALHRSIKVIAAQYLSKIDSGLTTTSENAAGGRDAKIFAPDLLHCSPRWHSFC